MVRSGGKLIAPDYHLDYAGNFAHMLGHNAHNFHELMRLYLTIHRCGCSPHVTRHLLLPLPLASRAHVLAGVID